MCLLSPTFIASEKEHKAADRTAEVPGMGCCACNVFPHYASLVRDDAPELLH